MSCIAFRLVVTQQVTALGQLSSLGWEVWLVKTLSFYRILFELMAKGGTVKRIIEEKDLVQVTIDKAERFQAVHVPCSLDFTPRNGTDRHLGGEFSHFLTLQIVDPSEIEKMVNKVLSENPKQLEQYQGGKTKLQGFFAGQDFSSNDQKLLPGNENIKRQGKSRASEQDPYREIKRQELKTLVVVVAVAISRQPPQQDMEAGGNSTPRKVMLVADPTRESAGALQYALSHVLVEQDELILIHVEHQSAWKNPFATLLKKQTSSSSNQTPSALCSSSDGGAPAAGEEDFLDQMKHACEVAQPKLQDRDEISPMLILRYKRPGGASRGARGMDTAEYLIENSKCTCVGVQRKGQNAGYLLNTKTHKNFWLLA
ncbi:hypothetical protein Patl1_25727 [Pistacia atlantica]|uniref:Uncharacterized protein n=1 Tax=Pistacia atlantica TaxID=434234 RepID=A0ACC1B071_9ROSI|nr:hypothetical protein Patl1_25727 [Pistacia atlantica]